jgi:hypothetical protein
MQMINTSSESFTAFNWRHAQMIVPKTFIHCQCLRFARMDEKLAAIDSNDG